MKFHGVNSLLVLALLSMPAHTHAVEQTKGSFSDKFRQLEEELPTPNIYRNAAGQPAQAYWQQKASYQIAIRLDEENRSASGSETISYRNNSPDTLKYLWLQLDQNRFHRNSMDSLTKTMEDPLKLTYQELRYQQFIDDFDGGFKISRVRGSDGKPLPHTIVGTLMRIDLPQPLAPGKGVRFSIDWQYKLVDSKSANSRRDGYEYFPADGNNIFLMAQWYPRMVAYSDYEGWHNKEFVGRGEFTLEFGDFDVRITVPADHIVSSTGELQNPAEVLTREQRQRLKEARNAEKPVFIVTPAEALANEAERDSNTRTWRFAAKNVRDFAFASSRKFIWDAQGFRQDDANRPFVMAMSFYPKEGEPLWSKYSTQAVIHTMEVYSRYSFAYPYPVAQSVNGPAGGMEYPMITFNGPRTELQEDGSRTYTRSEKRFLIGVV
ncbi:MAG: aminopeptidase, partial [Gammaproteobacteria bacterium]|nr:aminopeptidase [Gammaproteobacteria bacterium]